MSGYRFRLSMHSCEYRHCCVFWQRTERSAKKQQSFTSLMFAPSILRETIVFPLIIAVAKDLGDHGGLPLYSNDEGTRNANLRRSIWKHRGILPSFSRHDHVPQPWRLSTIWYRVWLHATVRCFVSLYWGVSYIIDLASGRVLNLLPQWTKEKLSRLVSGFC